MLNGAVLRLDAAIRLARSGGRHKAGVMPIRGRHKTPRLKAFQVLIDIRPRAGAKALGHLESHHTVQCL